MWTGVRYKKWWLCLFTWLIDASLNNAWTLANSCGKDTPQKDFRKHIALHYVNKFGIPPTASGNGLVYLMMNDMIAFHISLKVPKVINVKGLQWKITPVLARRMFKMPSRLMCQMVFALGYRSMNIIYRILHYYSSLSLTLVRAALFMNLKRICTI